LVGAGPGDPDLLTIKALRALRMADVVLHDALVSSEILQLLSGRTRIINVGKRCGCKKITQDEINGLLIQLASSGNIVVRLKSGDPLIFGRAGEELEALKRTGINVEIVPGITAAVAAAATAQVSLTDRRMAERLLVISGHQCHEKTSDFEFDGSFSSWTTIVVYMPGEYGRVAERLRRAGVKDSTPCLLVSQLSTLHERSFQTTLKALAGAPVMPAPSILIVGETIAKASSQELRAVSGNYIPVGPEPSLPTESPGT
jgi:uroporphyrin-III C-methyltransferase